MADPKSYTMAQFMAYYNFSAADVASGNYPFLQTGGVVLREDRRLAGSTCASCSGAACTSSSCSWDWCVHARAGAASSRSLAPLLRAPLSARPSPRQRPLPRPAKTRGTGLRARWRTQRRC